MDGYNSDMEIPLGQTGGKKQILRAKTMKQRLANKARHDARRLIQMTDTLPKEVRASGFHYDSESNQEVLEESRELGNQTDDESEYPLANMKQLAPIIKQHSLEYRVVANKRPGGKPVVQIKGLALDYDNTQSPFVKATYLENGRVATGVVNAANQQFPTTRKKLIRKRKAKTAKKANKK